MEQMVILSSSGTHFRKPVWLLDAEDLSLSPGVDSSRICKLGRNRKVSPQDLPFLHILMGFPSGSVIKNLPAMKESQQKQAAYKMSSAHARNGKLGYGEKGGLDFLFFTGNCKADEANYASD